MSVKVNSHQDSAGKECCDDKSYQKAKKGLSSLFSLSIVKDFIFIHILEQSGFFFFLHNIVTLDVVFYNLQKLKFKSLSFKIPVRSFCLFAQSLIVSDSFGPHGL